MFGFPAKSSWLIIVISPRRVTSSSQQILSAVSNLPTTITFSKHWRGVTPPCPPYTVCPDADIWEEEISPKNLIFGALGLNFLLWAFSLKCAF